MPESQIITNTDLDVRHFVYTHFIETTRPPAPQEIAENLSLSTAEVEQSLGRLADAHQIALAPGSTSIWMAHPFSSLPTNFTARADGKLYWGN